jgi:fatty acid desaturase
MALAEDAGMASPQAFGAPRAQDWKQFLDAEKRAQLAEWHRINWWTPGKALALLAIWGLFGFIAVRVDVLWVQIPCWIVIGFVLHGFGILMHEGAHRSLFRTPWLDRVVGFLCGLPVMFSCSSYRATHMLHHQFENTARDPDNMAHHFPNPVARAVLYYAWFVIGMPLYILVLTFTGPFRARRAKEKLACVVEPVLIIAFYVTLFTLSGRYGWGEVVANAWGWALPFAVLIANLRGLAEHTQLWHSEPPDPLQSTRSLESNRFISFFFNNQNYHLEHHLYPGIPWNHLPKVHRLMRPVYEARGASVTAGYSGWLLNAFRHGPNRTLRYRNGRAYVDAHRS